MISYKYTLISLSIIIFVINFTQTAQSKSVYVISDTETSHLRAYKIEDTNLVYQTDYVCDSDPSGDTGAVGLAIDESQYGQFLFVTFEDENIIELVNAKTIEYVGVVEAPQANNLAGIIVDQTKGKVYTVDRGTDRLYSYTWDPVTKTFVTDFSDPYYVQLEGISHEPGEGAYGLALDEVNSRLYVADNTTTVKCYDANDPNWSKLDDFTFTITDKAVGIEVDVENQFVYTGASQFNFSTYITKYNLGTSTETRVDAGSPVLGITVDQDTSLIYLTTFQTGSSPNRLIIYDANLVKQPWESGDIGNPAGVAVKADVSYKPSLFTLEKVDVNAPNPVVLGDYITYEITYGPNGLDHNNVVLTNYLSYKVDFEDVFDPNYNPDNHTYTWNIGSLPADAPEASVTLTVKVNEIAEPYSVITNYCEIESDLHFTTATADTNVGFWQPDSNIIYVDNAAFVSGTGMSWRSAYVDLQDALERADNDYGSEIWVAAGTYKPTTDPQHHDATFQLVNGIPLYGGFAGNESSRNQRNWVTNETILSGDIKGDGEGNISDDVDYVVTASNVGQTTIIDGFTIKRSYYNAGIKIDSSSPTIRHNKIKENDGMGIECENSSSVNITNCQIQNNGSDGINCTSSDLNVANCQIQNNGSDGINCTSSELNVANCLIENNDQYGLYCTNCSLSVTNSVIKSNGNDGIYIDDSDTTISPIIKNNCIYKNGTGGSGCGIYIRNSCSHPTIIENNTIVSNTDYEVKVNWAVDVTISNCIIWGDNPLNETNCDVTYSCIQGGYTGECNINVDDPCFVDDANDNYHIAPNSPCIDKGRPGSYPGETDIDGEKRVMDGDANGTKIVDMGADEYYWSPADFNHDRLVNFLDYCLFASAWQTEDPSISLDEDNYVDINDLTLFCNDWLLAALDTI